MRSHETNALLKKNPKLTYNEAFEKSRVKANQNYDSKLNEIITRLTKEAKKGELSIVFLDKNHPPNGIFNAVNLIDRAMPSSVPYRKLYLVPEVDSTSFAVDLPFSY